MNRLKKKQLTLNRRKQQIRTRIRGTSQRPRLSVFRSLKHIYAQIIDDEKSVTLVSASTLSSELKESVVRGGNISAAKQVGKLIAQKAKEHQVESVVFDRGGNLYHGRIKALADAAREVGLKF